jgi:biofilm PGA synthesis N-glycosyltransferase PgaC
VCCKIATPSYVLITPARNEAEFIELTIKSVVAQTVRPLKWVIVSDGSTDGTDDIVRRYASNHAWMELIRMPERRERHFAAKVEAFNAGYERVRHDTYEAIGSLDADLSFDEDYFQFLLGKLGGDTRLGLVGTPFCDMGARVYDYRFVSIEHVSGACQLFRRQCFEEVGGYVPVKGGGVDLIAVTMARMKGWRTRTFTERQCLHHRSVGSAHQGGSIKRRFNYGIKDYSLGNHPIWEMFRTVYQMTQKPFVLGGLALWCGYFWALIRRTEKPVSSEFVAFVRRGQISRLRHLITRRSATCDTGA